MTNYPFYKHKLVQNVLVVYKLFYFLLTTVKCQVMLLRYSLYLDREITLQTISVYLLAILFVIFHPCAHQSINSHVELSFLTVDSMFSVGAFYLPHESYHILKYPLVRGGLLLTTLQN